MRDVSDGCDEYSKIFKDENFDVEDTVDFKRRLKCYRDMVKPFTFPAFVFFKVLSESF